MSRQIIFESPVKFDIPISKQPEYFIKGKDVGGRAAPFDDVALLQGGAMTNRCERMTLESKTVVNANKDIEKREKQIYDGIPALTWPSNSEGGEKSSSNRTKSDVASMSGKSFSEDRSLSLNLKKRVDHVDDNLVRIKFQYYTV